MGRILGPLNQRRTGYFFAYRRTAAEWTSLALSSLPTRVDIDGIDLAAVPARARGAEVHEVVPAETGGTPRVTSVRAQSVAEIPGGVVFGTSGWYGTDRTNVVVSPSQTMWPWPVAERRRSVAALHDAPETALSGTTVNLLHPGFRNYAHFILQLAPRLECVRRVVGAGDIDRVLIPDPAPTFVFEVLARMGIAGDQLLPISADPPRVYRCERLVTATVLDTLEVGSPWAADAVRVPFAAEIATRGDRRLYLAREPGFARRILNEDAVVALLETHGFESVSMAGRTVAEQAALVAGAECVVGLHGAALANWVFAASWDARDRVASRHRCSLDVRAARGPVGSALRRSGRDGTVPTTAIAAVSHRQRHDGRRPRAGRAARRGIGSMSDFADAARRLTDAGDAIVAGVERTLPDWVEQRVAFIANAWDRLDPATRAGLDARAAAAGRVAAERVASELRSFFATPVEEQRTTPLEIVRSATRDVTALLGDVGIPPVERDAFDERAFPDDLYGVTPASLSDLGDESLGPWQLAWGLAKARVLQETRNP